MGGLRSGSTCIQQVYVGGSSRLPGAEYAEGAIADPKLKAVISPHAGGVYIESWIQEEDHPS